MKKTELIAKLNAIEGDPMVLIPAVDFESIYDGISTVELQNIRMHECENHWSECTCKAVAHEDCIVLES